MVEMTSTWGRLFAVDSFYCHRENLTTTILRSSNAASGVGVSGNGG